MNARKILDKALSNSRNLSFRDFCKLIQAFNFKLSRVNGSHHIFSHPDITELVNVQNVQGQAKPYQIRQFLRLVEEYNIKLEDSEP